MDLKLKDKVVLVTGGTGGIGTAIVKGFIGEGAKVAFSSTSQKKIDDLLPTLGAAEGQVAGFVADLNKEEDNLLTCHFYLLYCNLTCILSSLSSKVASFSQLVKPVKPECKSSETIRVCR